MSEHDAARSKLADLPEHELRRVLAAATPGERARLVASLPDATLFARARAAVRALGIHEARITKQERIGGTLLPLQTLMLLHRPSPFAVRLSVESGPAKGRKVFFNEALDPARLRLREGGMLGLAGAVWIDLRSPLARRDTRHLVTGIGLAGLVERTARVAGSTRSTEARVEGRLVSLEWMLPGAAGRMSAAFEPISGLLLAIESIDASGQLQERVRYELLRDRLPLPDLAFRPEAFGL